MASRHRGVSWHKGTGKWEARIGQQRRCYRLGLFAEEEAAAEAYRAARAAKAEHRLAEHAGKLKMKPV